jgi:hypothetical protein
LGEFSQHSLRQYARRGRTPGTFLPREFPCELLSYLKDKFVEKSQKKYARSLRPEDEARKAKLLKMQEEAKLQKQLEKNKRASK